MSWDAIGAIGEIIGAIAVVATLTYLAIQTRLTRKALTDNAFNEAVKSFSSVNRAVIESKEMALIYEAGLRDPDQLSRDQAIRFFTLIREAMNGLFNLYQHYKNGAIDESTWISSGIEVFACCRGVINFMDSQKHTFDPSFLAYFDSLDKHKYDDPVSMIIGGALGDTRCNPESFTDDT